VGPGGLIDEILGLELSDCGGQIVGGIILSISRQERRRDELGRGRSIACAKVVVG